jgi:thiosulfate/3-mercaptopyruvate sulfurtransferase
MNINKSPVIEASALLQLLNTENLVLIDAGNRTNYLQKHLSGALFVDLNTDLADIKEDLSIGGRHPLPKIENFSKTLSSLGISSKSHVVVYDDKAGANAASRFWWMLKSIGHEKVQVLNGGIQAAEAMGFPMSSNEEIAAKTDLSKFDHWKWQIAEIDEVETASADANKIVIDVRDAARYNGEVEPIDLIAGHIPGAINVPFTTNLDKNGLFLSPTELKLKYEKILGQKKSEDIIVHCGSGVTACHTLLALAYAGLGIPKLYVGSWSEWSRNNKAIATKTVK